MILKELWAQDDEGKWRPFNVLSIGNSTVYVEGKPVGSIMMAVVYEPNTGEMFEASLIDCVIKTVIDERDKNSEPITFGAPREDDGGTEDRQHNNS